MPIKRKTINLCVIDNAMFATDEATNSPCTEAGVSGEDCAVWLHVQIPSDWQNINCVLQVLASNGKYDVSGVPMLNVIDMPLRQGVLVPGSLTVTLIGSDVSGIRKTVDCKTLRVTPSAVCITQIVPITPTILDEVIILASETETNSNSALSSANNAAISEINAHNSEVLAATYVANNLGDNTVSSSKLRQSTDTDKIQMANLSSTVLSAMNGTSPTGTTPVDGSVVNSKLANGAVSEVKTSFFKQSSKNLFNPYTVTVGYFVDWSTGNPTVSATYTYTDYEAIVQNTAYVCSKICRMIAFYNSSKVYISGVQNISAKSSFTTPTNAAFMRITLYNTDISAGSVQIEQGNVATAYEPMYYFNTAFIQTNGLDASLLLKSNSITNNQISDSTVTPPKTSFFNKSTKNLFNMYTVTPDYSVYSTNGILSNSGLGWYASDYITIVSSTSYKANWSSGRGYAWYDTNKTFISGGSLPSGAITAPSNAVFLRVSVYPSTDGALNTLQLEQGTLSTSYEPIYSIAPVYIPPISPDNFYLLLPTEICVAVGKSIEIYNKQICHCGNINNYHFTYNCTIGKTFKRKWSYTAVIGDVGTKVLTINVYDNNMNLIQIGTINIRVVNISTAISSKKILCIGDSLTNAGVFISQIKTQTDAMFGSNNLTFIGTQGTTPYKHEGYGGWSTASFVTSGSPFWNSGTSQLDFANYLTVNSLAQPDYVQIFLGTNDIFAMADGKYSDVLTLSNVAIARIKTIVDKILLQWAGTRIFLVLPQFYADQNGLGNNYGNTAHDMARHLQVVAFCQSMLTQFVGYNSKVSIVPIALTFDSDYGFTYVTQAVNPWSSTTEVFVTGGVHPSNEGYNQMGDMMFSHFVGHYLD